MKTLYFLLFALMTISACILDEPVAIDHTGENVCCRAIYLDTLDPVNHTIDFDVYETTSESCVNDVDNLIVRQVVSCQ